MTSASAWTICSRGWKNMRLDKYLTKTAGSRTKAADIIKSGRITVNGKVMTKPAYELNETDEVIVSQGDDYVSRSANKLAKAFDDLHFSVDGQVVVDIGASTGGFTDVCLRHGAKKVYAVDVGHDQLAEKLVNDDRVVNMEGHNAREIKKDWFDEPVDFVCMDVSFIGSKTVLDALFKEFTPEHMAILIKPQFECGPAAHNKNGILTNDKVRRRIFDEIKQYLGQHYRKVMLVDDILAGRSGNQEGILYASERRNA